MRRARRTPGEEVWRRKKSATMVAHAADAGHGCGRCPGALGCVRWLLASHGAKHSPPESSELPPPRNRNSQNESSFSAVFRPQRQNHGSFRNVCVLQNSLASSWCPGFLRRARGTPGEEVWRRKKSATDVIFEAVSGKNKNVRIGEMMTRICPWVSSGRNFQAAAGH